MNTYKIVHLTSVHFRYDTRIFLKECASLASKGYSVSLVVADGKGNETRSDVEIVDVGASKGRLDRIINTSSRILKKAIDLNSDLYHIHDPELIPIGLKLKKMGKKVIFDAHEDFPKQILSKDYLNPYISRPLSTVIKHYEGYACSRFDAIVAATPTIRNKFLSINKYVVDINNYPILGELQSIDKDWENISNQLAYVGNISQIRGIEEVIDALECTKVKVSLNLAGKFSSTSLRDELLKTTAWKNSVNELGQLTRDEVKYVLEQSIAGIVTFLPAPNHIDAQPNKMFEYMSAGLPVISSNFPLWVEIIEGNQCGICVNPKDPKDIADAIDLLVSDKSLSKRMGENGIKAINKKYNWHVEEAKLLKLYENVIGQ